MLLTLFILLSLSNGNEAVEVIINSTSSPLPNAVVLGSVDETREQINENAIRSLLSRVKDGIERMEKDLNSEINDRKRGPNMGRNKRSAEEGESKTHPALLELNDKMSEVSSSIDDVMKFLSSKVQKKKKVDRGSIDAEKKEGSSDEEDESSEPETGTS